MYKKLYDAIDNLWANLAHNEYTKNDSTKDRNLLIKAVKYLEAIDDAKPNEALKCLKITKTILTRIFEKELLDKDGLNLDSIEQSLIKAQKQEEEDTKHKKILKIIFEKKVDIEDIELYKNYKDYCIGKEKWLLRKDRWLTEKEFDLIKEYSNEQTQF